jgi:predicted AAA+ superfamily ATPase
VIESERAPELVYHFAKNPHVLADINQMSERDAAREIGRLEARLVKPTPRKQSKAPAPVKPVRGAATPVKPLSDLSMAEYAARRQKEIYG